MIKLNKKKGQILVENVIFIILNLLFLSMLILFVYSKSNSEAYLEEKYAKQIVLIIDSARPGTTVYLNMEDAIEKADSNSFPENEIVSKEGNKITVKLREGKGSSYYFFNDVDVGVHSNGDGKNYFIQIGDYK